MEILSEINFIRTHFSQLNPKYLKLFWLTVIGYLVIFKFFVSQFINLLTPLSPLTSHLCVWCGAAGVCCSGPAGRSHCSPTRAGISQNLGKCRDECLMTQLFQHLSWNKLFVTEPWISVQVKVVSNNKLHTSTKPRFFQGNSAFIQIVYS